MDTSYTGYAPVSVASSLFVGIDLGTSGCRAIAINQRGEISAEARAALLPPKQTGAAVEQAAPLWWQAVSAALSDLQAQIPALEVKTLAVDGTSGTLLLCDQQGEPLGPALMYNDSRSRVEAEKIAKIAPKTTAAHGATSTLAKLLHLRPAPTARALHQADWIVGKLTGLWGISDKNNCLKLGYDALTDTWPPWLESLGVDPKQLPKVYESGTPIGTISHEVAEQFGLAIDTQVVAGTTDSTAAFIATGATRVGEAVTSLGSTLVMKVISDTPLFAPEYGVYSQPLGDFWLVGGGSNSGGSVLRHYFTSEQIEDMTPRLRPESPTGLDYYPLISPGERFPQNNPELKPRLQPRPENDVKFFQAMLEAMAEIEYESYRLLESLGAPYPVSIRSAGGGAKNIAWTQIRQRRLNIPLIQPQQEEAAYGAALLALKGYQSLIG